MAQGQRLPDFDRPVAEVPEVVQVRAAEAGRLHGDLHFVGCWGGKVPDFL